MVEEVKLNLQDILNKIPGLYCILFSDREGVPLLKVANEKAPEHALRPNFISTFCLAIDQGGKLGLGSTKNMVCYYQHFQIVQMNKVWLIVTFIGNESCNTGQILALENQLDPIVSTLTSIVAES